MLETSLIASDGTQTKKKQQKTEKTTSNTEEETQEGLGTVLIQLSSRLATFPIHVTVYSVLTRESVAFSDTREDFWS